MPALRFVRPLRSCLAAGLLGLCACPAKVPATLDLPPEQPRRQAPQQGSEAEPGDSFDAQAALDDIEQLLVAVDAVYANRSPRLDPYAEDEMHSWLPNEGLRSLYYHAKQAKLSLELLGLIFYAPVFVAGPHELHPNLESEDFGRYNPVFVERVGQLALALGRDRARVERTRPIFERRLRRQARTYALVYRALHHNPGWYAGFRDGYALSLTDPELDFAGYDAISPLSEAFSRAGMTWYETDTAVYFWLRRDLDGTAPLWLSALEALLAAYGEDEDLTPPAYLPMP